ncbi:MAG TPA: hypothetical protein VKA44_00345 [Gemmatimonadota bacterium]|nr:hypothetical protein [Gemmatimonadota bacterium]
MYEYDVSRRRPSERGRTPAPRRRWTVRGLAATALAAACLLALTACRKAEADSGLSNAYSSRDALIEAVLDGLQRKDRDFLDSLRVTRQEHRDLLWDELPERRSFSFQYAWDLNQRHSEKGLTQALGSYGGLDLEPVSVEYGEPDEEYPDFTLHLGTVITVRRKSDGKTGRLRFLDVLLEKDGAWKLLNYRG